MYDDLNSTTVICKSSTALFDGPAYCDRPYGHRVDVMTNDNLGTGEFHQESFEGWVWDN